jgi:hypothetical protein
MISGQSGTRDSASQVKAVRAQRSFGAESDFVEEGQRRNNLAILRSDELRGRAVTGSVRARAASLRAVASIRRRYRMAGGGFPSIFFKSSWFGRKKPKV